MNRSLLLLALLLAACASPQREAACGPLVTSPRSPSIEAGPADFDDSTIENLSLERTRELALLRSPSAAAAYAAVLRAEARIEEARALFRPTFSLGTTGTLNDKEASFDLPGAGTVTTRQQWQQVWTASSSISLFDFGRDRAALAAARMEADAASLNARSARQRLLHDVTVAWHRVHATSANVIVSEETLRMAEKQLEDASAWVEAGKRTRDTMLTAGVDQLARRQDLMVARNARRQALRVLNILLCRPPDASTTLATTSAPPPAEEQLQHVFESASKNNPALLALRFRRAALTRSRESSERSAWPELTLNTSATRDSSASLGSSPESAQAVFSLNWLAIDGGRRAARSAGLSAELMELRAQELLLLQQLETDLSRAVLDLDEARSAAHIADQSVQAATENYRLVNDRAEAGTLSAREVLEARRTLAAARYAGTEAVFRQHTALAWIENLTGSALAAN